MFKYPFIAKPVDDGCSSAVKKIKSREELLAFCNLIFRITEEFPEADRLTLQIKPKEEFPQKDEFLVEELITSNGAGHFLEITGGLLTHHGPSGEIEYEVFEASEALAGGEVLSLEEKFLAGEGQNITPARYSPDPLLRQKISDQVKDTLEKAAKVLNIQGYARIDAFVRVFENARCEVIFIEVNSLPGMTPATCIFHQTAINGYKPYDFIDEILSFGFDRNKQAQPA
jgi:D-alanine-D-alanine ligase